MRAVNLFLRDAANLGARASSPRPYLQGEIVRSVALGSQQLSRTVLDDLSEQLVIVGGGPLLRQPHQSALEQLCKDGDARRANGGKLVLWGIGLDHDDRTTNDEYPIWLKKADLLGVRDWRKGPQWVPCVSCLSPEFDRPREVDRPLVAYEHPEHSLPVNWAGRLAKTNEFRTMREALDFLGRGEIVLTNSYHGAYWATLLGRKVVCWPWASRFCFMKHAPVFAKEGDEVGDLLAQAKAYPSALDECRSVNRWFRKRVYDLAEDLP